MLIRYACSKKMAKPPAIFEEPALDRKLHPLTNARYLRGRRGQAARVDEKAPDIAVACDTICAGVVSVAGRERQGTTLTLLLALV